MTLHPTDRDFMSAALALGRRTLGQSCPNPNVGCVIVKNGRIVGRGNTAPGGRPHAETLALANAGKDTAGATAYVTLEPCNHHGKTPACAGALIDAGIRRVVTAVIDPDPRTDGKGIDRLREAGIQVDIGCLADQAGELHAGYITRQTLGRPVFTLKMGQSLDGMIATATGQSQWITNPLARRYAHLLRARHDGILVGSGTAAADDPTLDCRIAGLEGHSPVRILLDRRLRLDPASKLVRTAGAIPLWVFTRTVDSAKARALEAAGVRILSYPETGVAGVASALGREMLTTVLIEGGGEIAAAFLKASLIDRVDLVSAPMLLGGDGRPSIGALGLDLLDQAPRLNYVSERMLGTDRLVRLHSTALDERISKY